MARRAARALLWSVWCALAAAVPLGISLLALRFVLFVWHEGYHPLDIFLIFGCMPVYLGLPWRMFRYAKQHRVNQIGKWKAVVCFVGVVVVFSGLFIGVMSGAWADDQQTLHDRGVTSTGVITKAEVDRGDSGSIRGVDTDVRLGDGKTINVLADVDENPQVGRTVQVTFDPLGRAEPRLGSRPPAPGTLSEKVPLAILIVGHTMTASSIAAPLGEALDPRRLRRRRAPADETPVDKTPSYGLEPDS